MASRLVSRTCISFQLLGICWEEMKELLFNDYGLLKGTNLLSRWHQLQLKLICELIHELQLVNWRQAAEGKGVKRSALYFRICTVNTIQLIQSSETIPLTEPKAKMQKNRLTWQRHYLHGSRIGDLCLRQLHAMVLIDRPPPYVCISESRVGMNHYRSALRMKEKKKQLGQVVPEERGTGAGGRMGP